MKLRTLSAAPLSGKTILLRTDFNVPLQNGVVQDQTRLVESLPTLQKLLHEGAKVAIISHLGRPKGVPDASLSLKPVAQALSILLQKPVPHVSDCIGQEVEEAIKALEPGQLVLLENLRFHPEEEANDPAFAKALAEGFDLFINDAFGTLHRAHASTVGVTACLPSYAGLLVQKEVEILSGLLENPEKPVCLIVGGAKIDTKIGILEKFLPLADRFIIGGALANTFLVAQGHNVGQSLYEADKVTVAQHFLEAAADRALLPTSVVLENGSTVAASAVPPDQRILDIGEESLSTFRTAIEQSKTLIWNGPMGLYESPGFEKGTRAVAEALAEANGKKIIGGGDTIDALNHFGIPHEKFTHISTGGGAMLEFLEGKMLPGVQALLDK